MLKFLLVVLLFAALVYVVVRFALGRGQDPPHRGAEPPRRSIAPDDDDQFLRDLDRKRKHPEDPDLP